MDARNVRLRPSPRLSLHLSSRGKGNYRLGAQTGGGFACDAATSPGSNLKRRRMRNSKKTLEPSDLKRQVQSAIKMAFQITFLFLGGVLLIVCTYLYLAFLEIYFG